MCTNAGVLRYRPANRYWVEFNHKRVRKMIVMHQVSPAPLNYACPCVHVLLSLDVQYVASMDDGVIGVVTDRNAEFYRVNIGAAYVNEVCMPVVVKTIADCFCW